MKKSPQQAGLPPGVFSCVREFARWVQVGMAGINVPIPVPMPMPMAWHVFGGWK